MANVITRLKVESAEYDSKIQRAVKGLQHMEEACRKVGGTFEVVEKDELEFVRQLGQMETVSKSVKGKLGELTRAFTELSSQYGRLSDEEKKSPFGQALSGSLEQLKVRIKDGKTELDTINKSLIDTSKQSNSLKGVLDAVAGKFGINTAALTKLGLATAAAKAAQESFQRIIAGSQTATDEYGRTMAAATRVTDGFFEAISRGTFGNFINGLQEVIANARNAYNALDNLATFNAFNSKEVSQFEARRSQYRANIRQGIDVEASKAGLQQLEAEERAYYRQAANSNREAGLAQLVSLTGSRAGSGWLMPYLNMGAGGQAAAAKAAQALRDQYFSTNNYSITAAYQGRATNNYKGVSGWANEDARAKYYALLNYSQLSDEQLAGINGYFANANNATSQMWNKVASDAELMNARTGSSGGGGTTTAKGSTANPLGSLAAFAGIGFNPSDMAMPEPVTIGLQFDTALAEEQLRQISQALNEQATDLQIEKTLKASEAFGIYSDVLKDTASAITVLSDTQSANVIAFGLNTTSIIGDTIKTITAMNAKALAEGSASAFALPFPANLAAWATIATTITSIFASLPKFAEGGVLGGSNFSGDTAIYRGNAGEVLFNQSDAAQLYSAIHNGNLGGGKNIAVGVKAEEIVFMINQLGMRSRGRKLIDY